MRSSFLSQAITVLLCLCMLRVFHASRFQFTLKSRSEECFMEEIITASSDNRMLFRFGILEPKYYDLVDVVVKSPLKREILAWRSTQTNFSTAMLPESGLYHLCFRKLKGTSSTITLFYFFDVVMAGARILTLKPNLAATISKEVPTVPSYTQMVVATVNGKATKMGIMEFNLLDVSRSIIRDNTRVKLLMTVDSIAYEEMVVVLLAMLPDRIKYPVTWETLESYATGGYDEHVIDGAMMEFGSHVAFDITEFFEEKLLGGAETIAFSIHLETANEAVVFGIHHASVEHFPQIVVEDIELELLHEVAYFKESVFNLCGDISLVKHRERLSRDAAESTNARVKWLSLLTNVLLVGIAFGQVIYIRSMLQSDY